MRNHSARVSLTLCNSSSNAFRCDGGIFRGASDDTVFSTAAFLNEDGIAPGNGRGNTLHANGFFQFGAFDTIDNAGPGDDTGGGVTGDVDVLYSEDFSGSGNAGFAFDPFGTDTAERGQFEIGAPQATSNNSGPFQLAGGRALVTGLSAGTGIGSFDGDRGVTTALSPEIFLPAGSINELNFSFNFAHTGSATANDQLRLGVLVDGQVFNLFQQSGSGSTPTGEFINTTVGLEDFDGNTIQILIEAEDDSNTIVEAAIDNLVIEIVG